jgi:hypothetical protein
MGKRRREPKTVKGALLCGFSPTEVHQRLDLPRKPKYQILYRRGNEQNTFTRVAKLLAELNCTPSILLCENGHTQAYHVLTAVIHHLGQLADPSRAADGRRETARHDDSSFVKDACAAFASALDADCWVAFIRNRRINRSNYFASDRLHVPQAAHGFLWKNDLPSRRLFDSTDLLQLHDQVPELASGGTFRLREDIATRSLSVRVAGEQLTLVVFCNWRRETTLEGNAKAFWNLVEESNSARADALNILTPAVRYFAGYLIGSGAEVSDGYERNPDITAKLVNDVWSAIASKTGIDYRALERAIEESLRLDCKVEPKIHLVEELPDGSSRVIISDPENYEVDLEKVRDGCLRYSTQSSDAQHLVKESVCAQAVAWGVSLLVNFSDLETRRNRSRIEDHFLRIRVPRKRKQNFELAVPIRDGQGKQEAVIGLNSRTRLESKHVRRIELLIQLYQQLRAIHRRGDPRALSFVDQLQELGQESGTSFQKIAKHFSEWVLDLLDADLVYLSLYHAAHDVFRMMGVSIHKRLYRAWLEHPAELNTFLGTLDDTSALQALLREMEDPSLLRSEQRYAPLVTSLLPRLLEHALITRLRPRRSPTRARGLTWEVFTGSRKPPFIFDDPENLLPSARYYTKTIYARTFAATPESRPDGVLWIGWHQKQAMSLVGSANELRDASQEAVLQQVLQLAAAIYAMSQYYNPDEALDPLPFRPAT